MKPHCSLAHKIRLRSDQKQQGRLLQQQPHNFSTRKMNNAIKRNTESSTATKGVRFSPTVLVRKTTHLNDYSEQEISQCWYSTDEYNKIRRDCWYQIEALNSGKTLNGRKYCSRGLEAHTTDGSFIKTRNRQAAIDIVLFAQYEEGIYDEDNIAVLYQQMTAGCQEYAILLGQRDQRTAIRHQKCIA